MLRKHLLETALLLVVLATAACFVADPEANQKVHAQTEIPSSIVEKSNQFIVSRVGQDFFDKYVKIDYNRSRYCLPDQYIIEHPGAGAEFLQRPYYLMVYSFKMAEKPFVDVFMEFAVDANGNGIVEREVMGIPDLINNPSEGNFPIAEADAMQIAKNAGLEDGVADWENSFHWYGGSFGTYVWTVQNTLQTTSGQGYLAHGKGVVIDANSGEILQKYEWETTPTRGATSTLGLPITFLFILVAIVAPALAFGIWGISRRKIRRSVA